MHSHPQRDVIFILLNETVSLGSVLFGVVLQTVVQLANWQEPFNEQIYRISIDMEHFKLKYST